MTEAERKTNPWNDSAHFSAALKEAESEVDRLHEAIGPFADTAANLSVNRS